MIKAAIIGFGGMGQRHYKAYKTLGADVSVCELDPVRVAQVAPEIPREKVYTDYRSLLAKERPDILSVVSNGPTHAAIGRAAAEAGVPRVLVEKPAATNLKDARALIEVCRRRGTRLAVNHIRRWSPSYDAVKNLLAEGTIGRLRHIYFHSGSTGLGNFAVHAFDTMRMLFADEPAWIAGALDRTGTPNPRGAAFQDPAGWGMIQFKKGGRAFADTSEDTGVQYQYVLVGEHGRMLIDELNDIWEVRARKPEDRKLPFTRYGTAMPPVPFKNPVPIDIVDLTRRAIENLIGERPVLSTGEDGLKSLEMVLAFHVSDEECGARVLLPLGPESESRDVPIA